MNESKKSIRIEDPEFVRRIQRYADETGSKTLTRPTQSLAEAELARREAGIDIQQIIAERDEARRQLADLRNQITTVAGASS